jgi:hypothetical protein
MDTYNQPTILELRYDVDATHQSCVFTGKAFKISKDMPANIVATMFEIVNIENYVGAITYGIRTPEISYMDMELETMLLEDGGQYPDPAGILERVKRALGNLQVPKQLEITANNTSISVVLDKLGDS